MYRPDADYNGPDTLEMVSSDEGQTGTGGTLTDTDFIDITVNAINDAPVLVTGSFLHDYLGGPDLASGLVIQGDGRIVAAGLAFSADPDVGLLRIDTSGALDPTFGGGTIIATDTGGLGGFETAFAVALHDVDGIVVAGATDVNDPVNFTEDFLLVRYKADGTLDTAFGSSGSGIVITI